MSYAGSSYGWAARSASTTSARRADGNTVSRRSSETRSSAPTSPTAGSAPASGRKVAVPSAYHEHRSYSPIRPAPAANTASLTLSSAFAGTKTTSFRSIVSEASRRERLGHGNDPGTAEADA